MTRGGNAGRGRGDGRAGRNGRGGGAGRAGRGTGYNPASKSTIKGLCKELEGHVFDYAAAEKMSMTMEKVQQYVGMKLGEDIANELKNRVKVVIPPPEYSAATKQRHQGYEQLVRTKQTTLLNATKAQLRTLQQAVAASSAGIGGDQGSVLGDDIQLKIARLENEIADLEYESQQPVPYKLTAEEDALYYNEGKAHSARVAALEAHRGKAFSLIMGQCTQLLLDKMKQEKTWDVVSASYDPLELYKLIESVVLKQ